MALSYVNIPAFGLAPQETLAMIIGICPVSIFISTNFFIHTTYIQFEQYEQETCTALHHLLNAHPLPLVPQPNPYSQ